MFNLSRYFSLTSLVGIGLVVFILSIFLRHVASETLKEHQTRSNVDITYSFANSIWSRFSDFIDHTTSISSVEEFRRQPELEQLRELAKEQMAGTHIVKVKIVNVSGRVVFSSDPGQIGKDKSAEMGFQMARSGTIASEIVFRDQIFAFEGAISDRNVVASHIPIRRDGDGAVQAVFEVYSDVTPLIEDMEATQTKIILGVVSSLMCLYLFLLLIVRRADNILSRQDEERVISEEKIVHQAYHDSLTGLPNRKSFVKRMDESVCRARRHKKHGALMMLDINRFKLINDSLGSEVGDHILRITAGRIQQSMREMDQTFRMGGDEFIVILEDLERIEDAAAPARRLMSAMSNPISVEGHEVLVSLSVGIAAFPEQDLNTEVMLKEANTAMSRAKRSGVNEIEFYSPEMSEAAIERLELETDLQRAVSNEEFVLFYQTKVDAHSMEALSVEALLRWQHPTRGLVPPGDFIPLLEELGLIVRVGNWVLNTACRQARAWLDESGRPLRMSVNISAIQFRRKNFVGTVREALRSSGLEAKYLELELTESMFVEDTEYAISVMNELKQLGVTLSIDDFGSGYSSLSYLKQFPIDYLKIDRSFVKDLSTNRKDLAITTAIAALAHSLDLGLIAEGVENSKQVDVLRDKGCHELQGFLFCKPVPAEVLEKQFVLPRLDASA